MTAVRGINGPTGTSVSDNPRRISGSTPGGRATAQAGSRHGTVPRRPGGQAAESSAVTGKPVKFTNPGLVATVTAAFRSDGSLITVGSNGTAYTWDVTEHGETSEVAAPRGAVFLRAAFSPDGNTLAAQNSGGVTYIFREAATPTTLPANDRIYPGSFANAGLTMVARDSARTGADVWVGDESTPSEVLINPDNGAALTSVALSADAKTVAASDDSGRTYLWDANTRTSRHVLVPPDRSVVTCSVFSFFGGNLITGNRDGRAYVWDSTTGTRLRSVRDPSGSVHSVAIGEVGQLLATAGAGNAIHFWNVATGASLGTIHDPGGRGVISMAFNLEGTQLAVVDQNSATYVWSLTG